MQFTVVSLGALALALSLVTTATTFSQQVCLTKYGPKLVNPVPTSTSTRKVTFPVFKISKSYKTTTQTSPPVTSTSTSFEFTTDISTITTTITTTTTSTAIVDVTTTTIPTSAGFTPIQNLPGNPPSKRAPRVEGHTRPLNEITKPASIEDLSLEDRATKNTCTIVNGMPHLPANSKYAASVKCKKFIEVITTRVITIPSFKKVTSILAPSTVLTTMTITQATNSAVTETKTVTSTVVTTVIKSVTVSAAPTATAYAACAPNNFVSSRNGNQINYFMSQGGQFVSASTPDAVSCCAQCQNTENCGGTAFIDGFCILVVSATCPIGNQVAEYGAPNGFPGNNGFTISDGNCGIVRWDGLLA